MDAVREVLFDSIKRNCLGVDPLILDQENLGCNPVLRWERLRLIEVICHRVKCKAISLTVLIVDTSGIHLHFVVTIPYIVDHELYNAYPF